MDAAFLFRGGGGPETDITNGIDNLKLKVRYKLGDLQKFLWSILG